MLRIILFLQYLTIPSHTASVSGAKKPRRDLRGFEHTLFPSVFGTVSAHTLPMFCATLRAIRFASEIVAGFTQSPTGQN